MTIEQASFERRRGLWKETNRCFIARYSWDTSGRLAAIEEDRGISLFAYNESNQNIACYSLDASGTVTGWETMEWDKQSHLLRRAVKTRDSSEQQVWTYQHDISGRMASEQCGSRLRVEKYNQNGFIIQESLYDDGRPELTSEYFYDQHGSMTKVLVKDPYGARCRKIEYVWGEDRRLESILVWDSRNELIIDETYVYGATHGAQWLERVTWVPEGRRRGKKRPRDVVYRSLSFGRLKPSSPITEKRSIAFSNGVYHGSVLNGKPEGHGIFQYNDESCYKGDFRDGRMEGQGKLTYSDGREMEGRFKGGLIVGTGRCAWADGSRYEGSFKDGKMDGLGVFIWTDGTRFKGQFENGRITDHGVWEYPEK